jgi:hypothetical protein
VTQLNDVTRRTPVSGLVDAGPRDVVAGSRTHDGVVVAHHGCAG